MISLTSPLVIAKETRVGGTCKSSKDPDILSFPPIEANFNAL